MIAANLIGRMVNNVNSLWKKLLEHCGHHVEIVVYGNLGNPDNVSLECEDCNEVILDAEIYTVCARNSFREHNYEKCKGCVYYYGEIDSCMYDEPDVPMDAPCKCKEDENG